jgi:hypothetical protein
MLIVSFSSRATRLSRTELMQFAPSLDHSALWEGAGRDELPFLYVP